MATATAYAHIELDASGAPVVSGTRHKVRLLALDHLAHGLDAEEIRRRYPDLSLGQVHSALAYFYDHQAEMERDLDERHRRVQALRAAQGESPGRRKLRDRGLLP